MNELMTSQPGIMQIPVPAREDDDDIDVHALFETLVDHKWLILIGTAVFFLLGVFYVLVATPVYEANAMVQVERSSQRVPGQDPREASPGPAAAQAVTEIPLMTSRNVVGNAVDELGLLIHSEPRHFPLIGGFIADNHEPEVEGAVAEPWFGLEQYGWGGAQLEISRLEVPAELQDKELTLVAGRTGRYELQNAEGVTLVEGVVGETMADNGVTIQVDQLAGNPGMEFSVVKRNRLTAINSVRENLSAMEQGRESGIISLAYRNTDPLLAAAVLEHITESYVRQNMKRTSAEAEKSLQFVQEQLPKIRKELEEAQTALNAFQEENSVVNSEMQTQALLNQLVAANSSIMQLRVQQAELDGRFTDRHPAYRAVMQQIGALEGEKGRLDARLAEMPDIQQGLLKLTRDVDVTNQTYTNLLNQSQQLDIARASAIGTARVVDSPAVNMTNPVWPKPLPIVLGATALGALLMIAFVFVKRMLDRGVQDAEEVEQLGLPVYASIFLSEQQRNYAQLPGRRRDGHQHLLALKAPSDMAMEALRSLRTSLHFARLETKNNLLMIAGPSPGVGKTFVCSNLAVTIAQTGQKVLLIDADMRRGTLHEVMGERAENGLSELISRQIPVDAAIRPVTGMENLSFISRGQIPPNPSELLMHPNFAAMLQQLAPRYDLIIVDTPPVLAVTDAAVIGQHVGTSLLVVRSGQNQSREISLAKQRLEQNGVAVTGAIVNAVQKKRNSHQYVYSYYDFRQAS